MVASELLPPHRVTILAVLNLTPDSFSDGGVLLGASRRPDLAAVAKRAEESVAAGAQILDVGGESTRPGAEPVPEAEELRRVLPAVELLAERGDVPISIDTRRAAVAEAALARGARIVNDVSGLRADPALAEAVARAGAGLVLGHLRGDPATMQDDPHFDDVLAEVAEELGASVRVALRAGVAPERLAVDPGIGFGKRLEDNLALLANAGSLRERIGLPVLVGPSRKSFLGALTGDPPPARDRATAAACAVAIFAGADAVRVHDVAGAVRAAAVARALRAQRRPEGSP